MQVNETIEQLSPISATPSEKCTHIEDILFLDKNGEWYFVSVLKKVVYNSANLLRKTLANIMEVAPHSAIILNGHV